MEVERGFQTFERQHRLEYASLLHMTASALLKGVDGSDTAASDSWCARRLTREVVQIAMCRC